MLGQQGDREEGRLDCKTCFFFHGTAVGTPLGITMLEEVQTAGDAHDRQVIHKP